MDKWVTIYWTGKFKFRGRNHYRDKKESGTEKEAKEKILTYVKSMHEIGFALLEQTAEIVPYGDPRPE